jgi:hypothetical protein
MLDALVLADLRYSVQVALNAALRVGSVFERRAELLFLFLAMRTPIGSIHLHATILKAAREAIVLVLRAVAQIVSQSERSHDQDGVDRNASPIPVRSCNSQSFLLAFSALLRHEVFISRLLRELVLQAQR